jgi:hypothetical protein
MAELAFREQWSEKSGRNCINYNDTKIGKSYFIQQLEAANPGCCYDGNRKPIQTHRPYIRIADIIFPYIKFDRPEFNGILEWMKGKTITETKGAFDGLECTLDGFTFDFGQGGIHASVSDKLVDSSDSATILDVDVTSFYPSIAIVNRLYPAHLGETFCDIYANVKKERMSYDKKTVENKALKLALNGTFGDTNNVYSPLYDPQYTMAITINGQLLLCMLAEKFMTIPGLEMIQANTDGMTVKCPNQYIDYFRQVCKWWEKFTLLDLEEATYIRMWIRDVNNYLAEYEGGKTKAKGAFETGLEWHKNHSALIIPKCACEVLTKCVDVREYVTRHPEPMDFLLRTKVPRTSRLLYGESEIQNITRYYISHDGKPLTKVMPPLARKPGIYRHIGVNVGWLATECNEWKGSLAGINYEFYIQEIEKLTKRF